MPRIWPLLASLLLTCGCPQKETPTDSGDDTDTDTDSPSHLLAFGDVHGDLSATRAALTLAGVIDGEDHWIGGDTVLVQTGDQLDRGDEERAILDWFEVLRSEAAAAGGAFHPLLGNHEVMNVELDLRYVTDGGWLDFADVPFDTSDSFYDRYEPGERGRVAAFRPGGPYALVLADHPVSLQLGDTVFVHAGLLPEHVEYGIDLLNEESAAWMRGEADEPSPLPSNDAPVWTRDYSDSPSDADCATLSGVLESLGTARMVVGHSVHSEITAYCDGLIWCIDTGMAEYYGGSPAVWELLDGQVNVLQ